MKLRYLGWLSQVEFLPNSLRYVSFMSSHKIDSGT